MSFVYEFGYETSLFMEREESTIHAQVLLHQLHIALAESEWVSEDSVAAL